MRRSVQGPRDQGKRPDVRHSELAGRAGRDLQGVREHEPVLGDAGDDGRAVEVLQSGGAGAADRETVLRPEHDLQAQDGHGELEFFSACLLGRNTREHRYGWVGRTARLSLPVVKVVTLVPVLEQVREDLVLDEHRLLVLPQLVLLRHLRHLVRDVEAEVRGQHVHAVAYALRSLAAPTADHVQPVEQLHLVAAVVVEVRVEEGIPHGPPEHGIATRDWRAACSRLHVRVKRRGNGRGLLVPHPAIHVHDVLFLRPPKDSHVVLLHHRAHEALPNAVEKLLLGAGNGLPTTYEATMAPSHPQALVVQDARLHKRFVVVKQR